MNGLYLIDIRNNLSAVYKKDYECLFVNCACLVIYKMGDKWN